MNREAFALKLKEGRIASGFTQKDVADALGRPQQTIGAWEVGRSQPDMDTLSKLLQLYHISANDFFEFDEEFDFKVTSEERTHIKKYRTLDEYGKDAVNAILDCEYNRCTQQSTDETSEPSKVIYLAHSELKASAGFGWNLDEQQMEKWKVLLNDITRKADFCVDVSGDSMEPKFHDGDIILVRSQPSVELGEIGLYVFDGCGYVKRQGDGKIESINPQYPDIEPTESSDIDCKGLILGILDPEWIIEK